MKRILLIQPDGSTTTLPESQHITLERMEKILGGWVEHVRVLDRILSTGERIYSSMYVNEEGLLKGMPRNQKATEIYQRNVRTAFANYPKPFRVAKEAMRASYPAGTNIIGGTPPEALAKGYADDPWIAGPALYFEGWNTEEVESWLEEEGTI